jgi:hypothetical protein
MRVFFTFMIAGCAATGAWAAGVVVRAVVPPVLVLRDGDPTPIEVTARMMLADADELMGGAATACVQLECANGATQTLSDKFHAVVNARSATSRCAIDLKSGTAVATVRAAVPNNNTDNDASINGGPYAMNSHHTQFGVAFTPGAHANAVAFVVEGEAVVSDARKRGLVALKDGQSIDSLISKVARIPEQTFRRIVTAYAQLDLAQLGPAVTPQIAATLQTQWLAALKQPRNTGARKALAQTHQKLGLGASLVSQYQIAQANDLAALSNTIQNPMQGEYRLDFCLHYSKTSGAFGGCGGQAADAWCKARGFAKARQWVVARDIGATSPTSVIGDDRICNDARCDGFASITCE